ncbi:MAM and LDL-receptor class A domain-containing protein 1-like [Orbicella faveolata]|uniref:MAM and LDL-receptor class A domain-containing protein 1-like n=1 Tax=Orbicella faveolata TaxID=48498 RepID=UPI0009E607E8|nr:MAM and LDL-receptor class A domain-containing protein 1-like [Orbicella faveolata]
MCGFLQDKNDKFDWTRNKGGTPSTGTGPSADHTTGTGYFMYTETSSPRQQGDNAKLNSPKLQFSGNMCLQFFYHMYGSTMGTLNVEVNGVNVFSKSGDQGKIWHEAKKDVNLSGMFTVTFEGITGTSWKGDIAIDDFLLTPGRCLSSKSVTS